jgi:hypothetical protein
VCAVGLKYHEELQLRMPRHEATALITTVQAAVERLAPGRLPVLLLLATAALCAILYASQCSMRQHNKSVHIAACLFPCGTQQCADSGHVCMQSSTTQYWSASHYCSCSACNNSDATSAAACVTLRVAALCFTALLALLFMTKLFLLLLDRYRC